MADRTYRFDKFSEDGRNVLTFAQEECQRFNHRYLGPEHILLALFRNEDEVAARVLAGFKVDVERVRDAVQTIAGSGKEGASGQIGVTERAKKVIELAVDEAGPGDGQVGTEHFLLAILREGQSAGFAILQSMGVTLDRARAEIASVKSADLEATAAQARETASEPVGEFGIASSAEMVIGESAALSPTPTSEPSRQGNSFDKFTTRAHAALTHAQERAQEFKHVYIGPEHVLLGLVHDNESVAQRVLESLDVNVVQLVEAVELFLARGSAPVSGEIGLTANCKRIFEYAVEEARRINHSYIGTEHLLLGVLREGQSVAAAILQSMGVTLDRGRTGVASILSSDLSSRTPNSPAQEAWRTSRGALNASRIILGESGAASTSRPDTRHQSADRFDRFTERARRVLQLARDEARTHHRNQIDTEHLLLALTKVPDGVAVSVLKNLSFQPVTIHRAIGRLTSASPVWSGEEAGMTARAKKAIVLAVSEARRLDHTYVGTEHLLAGLLLEGEGAAFAVLESLGLQIEDVRAETLRLLEAGPGQGTPGGHEDEADLDPGLRMTNIAVLRTAPNADLRDNAIGLLRDAKGTLDDLVIEGLAKALVDVLVAPAVVRLIDLVDLQTFNNQEFEDAMTRIKQSLDVVNAAVEALQPFDLDASTALLTASAAVQRALAR